MGRGDPAAAAAVFEALGERAGGDGDAAVSLDARASAYQCASLQAKAAGDADGADRAAVKLALVGLQGRAAAALERAAARASGDRARALSAAAADLQSHAATLDSLYNDVAVPHALWGLAVELVSLARYGDAGHARALWDVLLTAAWDGAGGGGGGGNTHAGLAARGATTDAPPPPSPSARRAAMADVALDTAARLPPGDSALPLAHIARRLAAAAAGAWPRSSTPAPLGDGALASTLTALARGSAAAAADALGAALADSGSDAGGDAAPRSRLAALDALTDVLTSRAARVGGSGGGDLAAPLTGGAVGAREAAAVANAADRAAADARRVGGLDGDAVAARLDAVRRACEGVSARPPAWVAT